MVRFLNTWNASSFLLKILAENKNKKDEEEKREMEEEEEREEDDEWREECLTDNSLVTECSAYWNKGAYISFQPTRRHWQPIKLRMSLVAAS